MEKARQLREETSTLIKTFPSEEKYRLVDHIFKSSRSVTGQIAEGFGCFHFQENIQFCRQARGSLTDTLDHLICALDKNLIKKAKSGSNNQT